MGSKVQIFLVMVFAQILAVMALTDPKDLAALNALKSSWKNLPPNWKGSDPCGNSWDGITCNNSRVVSLMLAGIGLTASEFGDLSSITELQLLDLSNNIGLKGTLPSSIGNLKNLSILILVGCSFFGPIPDSIGSLQKLVYLSLNSNSFSGPIPPSIGNLSNLSWLDLSDNELTGTVPVSPGLDLLLNARHFHLSKNQLSGSIQPQLFSSNMNLIHAIFDHNQLTGNIPQTLGYVKTLEVIRLDGNSLYGSVPSNFNNLTSMSELYMSNNNFSGDIPDFTGMDFLAYVDMSNNSFSESDVPTWFSSSLSLTTLMMADTKLRGQIPVDFFRLPQLETVVLSNNNLNGTLDIGNSYSNNLALDLQNNSVIDFKQKNGYNSEITLVGNPICEGSGATEKYCTVEKHKNPSVPPNNCAAKPCSSDKTLSPTCRCSYPYTGTLHFFSFSFSNLENSSYYAILVDSLMSAFRSNGLPVDSVSLSDPMMDVNSYLQFRIDIFPSSQDNFNRTAISSIGFVLNRQPFKINSFGPFYFLDETYCCLSGAKRSSHTGIIIGVSVGCSVLVLLIILTGTYAWRQRNQARRSDERSNPFASWDRDKSGGIPKLKGARWFSFEEIQKCTYNFSESNCIGAGGYGKVYKGVLASGQIVAIKRAQQGSMQGALEFKTEIELLSRIHHKNVVSLVGFCYEKEEQMLVYEFISNGTLRESLSGKSGIQLDWMKRLKAALDAARGVAYLHELADPPIIHRDIKSNNILLDEHLNAKVADFGLSKLLGDGDKGYITTQVKGTLGYLDPEYYMTQQLTDKSDVYSFGVVLLELITARIPIDKGKHIVKVVQESIGEKLHQILDPNIGPASTLGGLQKYIDLAMKCVRDFAPDRPSMGEVVREIENIIQLASMSKYTKEDFSLSTFDVGLRGNPDQHNSREFEYSGGFPPLQLEQH